jgi:aminoglycoside phosphotransferase (APT) family kinase protein
MPPPNRDADRAANRNRSAGFQPARPPDGAPAPPPAQLQIEQLDLEGVAAKLSATFPDAGRFAPCTILGSGFNSIVVETAAGIVFRIARIPGVHDGYERERSALPILAPRLPVAVPDPRWYAPPGDAFPYGAIGYHKLDGTPLSPPLFAAGDRQALARDLGRFIAALHDTPLDAIPMLPLSGPAVRREKERAVRAEVVPALRKHLSPGEHARVEHWWDTFLTDPSMMDFPMTVTHGDLWFGNVLVDDPATRLLAVLDWEIALIGDPSRDFAPLLHLGRAFLDAVLAEYDSLRPTPDPTLRHRIEATFAVREFYGLRYAVQHHDPEELADAIAKLRRGAILSS